MTATTFYYQDAVILAKTADVLGFPQDAAAVYQQMAKEIRTAFNARFFNASTHQYASGSQCANALPLVMGLADAGSRAAVIENLVTDLRQNGLTAGDVGYRYLLRALADSGRSDEIYGMINQADKPGYAMQLAKGATSLTEAWDANPQSSQNHFMLGQINEWFFHDLAGIQSDSAAPGFKKIILRPAVISGLAWQKTSYDSVHGLITSEWKNEPDGLTLHVDIPAGTTATVYVPAADADDIREGSGPAASANNVTLLRKEAGLAAYEMGSGDYVFSTALPR